MLGAEHVLEVGSLGGHSAIWPATANAGMLVTTIAFDPHHANVARANIEAAGVSDLIEVILGAGMDVLPQLIRKCRQIRENELALRSLMPISLTVGILLVER